MKLTSSLQNRKRAGIWLRGLREEAGLTQRQLARRLRIKYYAFVSQVETGLSRVPTDKLEAWAQTLDVDPTDFAKRLISFYEPELHRILYEARSRRSHQPKKRSREDARQSR